MKIIHINDVCDNFLLRKKLFRKYYKIGQKFFELEMPDWPYLNEFESIDLINWWDMMFNTYNLIPGETFRIYFN